MPEQNTVRPQITRMRERVEQLYKSALQQYPAQSPIIIRLQLILDEFCALEIAAGIEDAIPVSTSRWGGLSDAEVERIATAIAKKLNGLAAAEEPPVSVLESPVRPS